MFTRLWLAVCAGLLAAMVFHASSHAQDDVRPRERVALFRVESPMSEQTYIEAWAKLNRFSETMLSLYGLRPREFLFKAPGENGADSYFIGWVYRP